MILAVQILGRAAETLGRDLPRLVGALVLLPVGLVVARLVGRIVRMALQALGSDELAERVGVSAQLARVGLDRRVSAVVGRAVRWALVVIVVVASVSLLGLQELDASLNAAVLFLPRVFAAAVLLVIGATVGQFVRAWVAAGAETLDLPGPLGALAEVVVLAVFVTAAVAQLGVPTGLLTILVAIVVGAAGLAAALALGLGGRDVARQISAGRVVRGVYRLGQRVRLAGADGEIAAFERASVVMTTRDGRRVRVPNQVVLESIVEIDDDPAAAG